MHSSRLCAVLLLAGTALACEGPQRPAGGVATESQALTAQQCLYFAQITEGTKLTICHRNNSAVRPYVKIVVSEQACGGHDNHAADYVAIDDPDCSGQGCYPSGAPNDGTVECCPGLAPNAQGNCAPIACPAHASATQSFLPGTTVVDEQSCACDAGYQGTLTWVPGATNRQAGHWSGACVNVDECRSATPPSCGANAHCVDTDGSYQCACDAYYQGATVTTGPATCADIDECATDNGGCGAAGRVTCQNNYGAAPTCTDVDECATDNGGCGATGRVTCTNNYDAAPTCTDVDECATNNGGCGAAGRVTCTNNYDAAPTCTDVDECATDNGGCGSATYSSCANNYGAAPTCSDIDECATNNGGCGAAGFVTCRNNVGAAPTCTDVDECATSNGGCGSPAAYACQNNYGAPPTCSDVNECLTNNGGCTVAGAGQTFLVSPRTTLQIAGCTVAPLALPLSGLGLVAGDRVDARMVGDFSYIGYAGEGILEGAFSTSSAPAGRIGDVFRIAFVLTRPGSNPADNFNGRRLTVPAGATHLLVALFDSNYCDNPTTDPDFGVQLTPVASCTNSAGSYTCGCTAGYHLIGDGRTCVEDPPAPRHQWTFNALDSNGQVPDLVGGAPGMLNNGATVANGVLTVANGSAVSGQLNGQYMSANLPRTLDAKTLVTWVSLANLTQRGGSALSLEDAIDSRFDAVVYAEQAPNKWMAGSDFFNRSPPGQPTAIETSTARVMMAIVYGYDHYITIYRNGQLYDRYTPGIAPTNLLQTYEGGRGRALVGLRHTTCGTSCWLSAAIDEARIYDRALTQAQVQGLVPVPDPSGNALSFDSTNDYVSIPASSQIPSGSAARTIEAWVYTRSSSWRVDRNTIFEYGVVGNAFAMDMDNYPNVQFYTWREDLVVNSRVSSDTGWMHVAMTYDGARLKGYVNGVLVGDRTATLNTPSTELNVGRSGILGTGTTSYDGYIDEVRIWNVARTQADIQGSMRMVLSGAEPGLVSYYRFSTVVGTTVFDQGPAANHGTLVGVPDWILPVPQAF